MISLSWASGIKFCKDGLFCKDENTGNSKEEAQDWGLRLKGRTGEAQLVYQSDKESTSWLIK
jgi:hypothetical protein